MEITRLIFLEKITRRSDVIAAARGNTSDERTCDGRSCVTSRRLNGGGCEVFGVDGRTPVWEGGNPSVFNDGRPSNSPEQSTFIP